ncbi:MAG: hypothetical protein IKK52_02915 [Alphaproteobacteria bacterium]|nr:hypothetical protein [Alphaproteobacteria bacterium]
MDIYPQNTSPLGYQTGQNGIDSYGVNHNGFTNQDEIAYQMARSSREQDLIKQYNAQGITSNYPQYTTNFWGNPANNYGFGNSNIAANIENMQNNTTPIPMATAVPQQQISNNKDIFSQFSDNLGNIARKTGIDKLTENIYNLGYDAAERLTYPQSNTQNYENKSSLAQAQAEAQRLAPVMISDVNKHQYVSCIGAFDGPISVGATAAAGLYKEGADLYKKWNNPLYGTNWDIIQDSLKDLGNDAIGIARGWSANNINDCNYLLPAYARKR